MLEKTTDLSLNPVGKNNRLGNYLESTMIFDKLFLRPTINQLTGRKRNWAKANSLILTGRNKNDAHERANYLMIFVNVNISRLQIHSREENWSGIFRKAC